MPKIIVLMGAPGAGKGTQARVLQERLGLPQISTGDMFRALAKTETPLAAEVHALQAAGRYVPDDVVMRIVEERTEQTDCQHGYILDGFPRTTVQAEMLERLAAKQGHEIHALLVDVPFDILERRMSGRRTCPICKESYNVYFRPPRVDNVCDLHPEAQLEHRADDNEETARKRLVTYQQETQPLLDYYAQSGRLQRIDGTRTPELIYADIEKLVAGSK